MISFIVALVFTFGAPGLLAFEELEKFSRH
jgi:hypothetical protein